MATFPTYLKFRSINIITDINVVQYIETINGNRSVILGDRIKTNIGMQTFPLTETENRQFQLFIKEIKQYGEFDINVSKLKEFKPINESTNIILPNSNAESGTNVIDITELGILEKGSFIKFSNHNQIYQVFEFSLIGSIDRLTITPNLIQNITTADTIEYNNIVGKYRFINGQFGSTAAQLTSTGEQLTTYTFTLEEV